MSGILLYIITGWGTIPMVNAPNRRSGKLMRVIRRRRSRLDPDAMPCACFDCRADQAWVGPLERDGFKLQTPYFNLKAESPSILLKRDGFSLHMQSIQRFHVRASGFRELD
jgi:hypothetical protein